MLPVWRVRALKSFVSKKRKGAGQGTSQVLKISDSPFLVVVEVFNQHVSALVDTGSSVVCCNREVSQFDNSFVHFYIVGRSRQ